MSMKILTMIHKRLIFVLLVLLLKALVQGPPSNVRIVSNTYITVDYYRKINEIDRVAHIFRHATNIPDNVASIIQNIVLLRYKIRTSSIFDQIHINTSALFLVLHAHSVNYQLNLCYTRAKALDVTTE